LCRRNHYRSPSAIRGLLSRRDVPLDLLRAAQDYTVLADLTGQSVDTLFGLTLHRFVPAYYLPATLAALPRYAGDIAPPLWAARWPTAGRAARPPSSPHHPLRHLPPAGPVALFMAQGAIAVGARPGQPGLDPPQRAAQPAPPVGDRSGHLPHVAARCRTDPVGL